MKNSDERQINNNSEIKSILQHFENVGRVDEYKEEYESHYNGEIHSFGMHRSDLIFRKILEFCQTQDSILEIGCGVGELLYKCAKAGFECTGIDISEEMVKRAKQKFTEEKIRGVQVYKRNSFEYKPSIKFSGVVANGVIPYYQDQCFFLKSLNNFLNINGKVFVTHRNQLFNFLALNQGTIDFFENHLFSRFPKNKRKKVIESLKSEFPNIMTAVHKSSSNSVFRSAQNPFTVHEIYQKAGFIIEGIYFTFIHNYPPRFCKDRGELFDLSISRYYEDKWEGFFLGSQFLVVAKKDVGV